MSVEAAEPYITPVLEPSTGAEVAKLVGGGSAEALAALQAARNAYPTWENTKPTQRATLLRAIAAKLRDADVELELATLISTETGKRIAEARGEVALSAQFFDWFATAIATDSADRWNVVPGLEHLVSKHPLGLVAVVTPWNFPVSIPARKIAAALAAGCPILFKPSEVAPASALRLAELIEAHVPTGLINTVCGDGPAIVDTWLADPAVRGLTFTRSTRVGATLAASAASRFVRCVLELGGNAPFIVLDDAELARAVELLLIAKYRNNGQSCIAANQVWVPTKQLDQFTAAFLAASNELTLGDPLDERTTLGPSHYRASRHESGRCLTAPAQQVLPRSTRRSRFQAKATSCDRSSA
jgi:succinate-semialdehyde dehydrogenase / glutarate-semialdehyde dehydrogenase